MNKKKLLLISSVVLLLALLVGLNGCRRVSLVGDSLLVCAQESIVNAINSNNGNSWVYKQHIRGGCTSYNNPVNTEIYSKGMEDAFGYPDVVVFSFGSNDMAAVAKDLISMESAIQSMQTLMNQAVAAGAQCIVMLESSHQFNADVPLGARFEMHMDDWFDHWHRRSGDNQYLGIPYKLLIADISNEIEGNIKAYIGDYIHFNQAGADLAAKAIVEKINQCPEGRWLFGQNLLKPEASHPKNPYPQNTRLIPEGKVFALSRIGLSHENQAPDTVAQAFTAS